VSKEGPQRCYAWHACLVFVRHGHGPERRVGWAAGKMPWQHLRMAWIERQCFGDHQVLRSLQMLFTCCVAPNLVASRVVSSSIDAVRRGRYASCPEAGIGAIRERTLVKGHRTGYAAELLPIAQTRIYPLKAKRSWHLIPRFPIYFWLFVAPSPFLGSRSHMLYPQRRS